VQAETGSTKENKEINTQEGQKKAIAQILMEIMTA
jgi:hypothetical protein